MCQIVRIRRGEKQVKIWRRSYDVFPPLITKDDKTQVLRLCRDPSCASKTNETGRQI
jgi:bisphosphoglycerate-dependent phosphoglycerate mutase